MHSSDWMRLARLPHPRQGADVQDLFFPQLPHEHEADVSRLRVKGFFDGLDDVGYDQVYSAVFGDPTVQFPDVHALLKTSAREGKVMRTMMTHVGQWLNRDAYRVADRASEKPPLWKDLLPGVQERHPDDAADRCLELQQRVLTFVREHLADFTHATVEPFLEVYPGHAVDTYAERFAHDAWRGLLILVYDFCGPSFQHDALLRFNQDEPSRVCDPSTSTIARGMCQVLETIPEVAHNPALRGTAAVQGLWRDLQPVVLRWAIGRCERFVSTGGESDGRETVSAVKEQLVRYRRLLDADGSSQGTGSTEVAARAEGRLADERPRPPRAEETPPVHDMDASPPAATIGSERTTPRLEQRGHTSSARAQRPQTDHSDTAPASSKPRADRPSIQPAPPAVHRDLDHLLGLSSRPRKLKRASDGRGWRSRPRVSAVSFSSS